MQRCAFTPYEGNKPYIFISYAHKDAQRVIPVLEELDRRGYRIWYDDGIAPGSEWPENIAQHLDACTLTLAFVSPSSIASANCRREVTFALSKHKPFLGIYLEETEMSLGMELQLSAQQCVMKYSYTSEEAFYDKVLSCPEMKLCLGTPRVVPQPVSAAEPVAVQQEVAKAKPKAPPKPEPKATPKAAGKSLDKKMIGLIAGGVAALILVLVLIFALSGGKENDPSMNNSQGSGQGTQSGQTQPSESGSDFPTNEKVISFDKQYINAEDIRRISSQRELQELVFTECSFKPGSLNDLVLPATLKKLTIINCTGVYGLNSISGCNALETLEIIASEISGSDLAQINSEVLTYVNLADNPGLTDLSFLVKATGLENLIFRDTGVSSVSLLAELKSLKSIDGSRTKVRDLTPLANLAELRTLCFADCGISDIKIAMNNLYLQEINLSGNQLTSLRAFDSCAVLERVDVSHNDLQDLGPLEKCTGLKFLDVSGNKDIYNWHLDFLPQCKDMKELYMDGLFLQTLEFVKDISGLTHLSANTCGITDISALSNLTQMVYLSLVDNRISDISPLSGLCTEEMTLDLSFNRGLVDVSALPVGVSFRVLNLVNEDLDISTIPTITGDTLIINADSRILELAFVQAGNFAEYAIVGCPMDQVVKVEAALGKDKVLFINTDEEYLLLLSVAELRHAVETF